MTFRRHARAQSGFTLLELMIAAAVLSILFMAFISTLTGSFLASNTSITANSARACAQRLMEETMDIDYADCHLLHQNAVLTPEGLACKMGVVQVSTDLVIIEVNVCKPIQSKTLAQLAAMSLPAFRNLQCTSGSSVRLLSLRAGR